MGVERSRLLRGKQQVNAPQEVVFLKRLPGAGIRTGTGTVITRPTENRCSGHPLGDNTSVL